LSVKVDPKRCTGCGMCEGVCPGDVLRVDSDTKLAYPLYPDDCWYCGACSADCPEDAIEILFPYLIR
jgi:NAD-dependent dihydropyrimidine dehydrogenase PreA subunit